jgi:RNA polymerase primary sigma factor
MSVKPGIKWYVETIQRAPLLTAEEEKELARRIIRSNDKNARSQLIRSNLRLVVSVARRYANRGLAMADLIGEGNVGLVQAVDAFNPGMNIRFSTYASWWIKQAIRRSFSDAVTFVRVPAYMYERISAWQHAFDELQTNLGRRPRIDEFATHMNSSPEKAWAIQWAMHRGSRRCASAEDGPELQDLARDEKTPSSDEAAAYKDDLRQMRVLLTKLDWRSATILKLRFGLEGEEPMTLVDVGKRLGVTRERVRQIEAEALLQLQACLNGVAMEKVVVNGGSGDREEAGHDDAEGLMGEITCCK